ncbi:hypothetical protein MNBD_GAMMA23-1751 [hydrothermal vent metagenome]|uniref:Uncharacterized protein n=1 Tax=hydrothermal vent metagenome TaxID=652676 RepID=A0A3B0ZX66_9ZZZZ
MKKTYTQVSFSALFLLLSAFFYSSVAVSADTYYKPFVLAQTVNSSDIQKVTSDVKAKISKAGFTVVGEYTPYANTHIVIITSPALRGYAAQSDNGVYGAVQRVSITVAGNEAQVAFTNPTYMSHVYRFKTDLADITQSLKDNLGYIKEYGSENGLTKDELRDYQYKWLMPYFTDRLELAEYSDQQEALAAVNKALTKNEGGVSKLYQVDLKGKDESVIGVSMKGNATSECSGDAYIMSQIDFKKIKSAGHLPYELIVKNGNVYALYAEFRIAINFPDLSMMGANSFMSIMCAPDSIKEALTLGAGGNPED